MLSGSGTDADGSIVAYKWRVVGGPAQSVLSSPSTAVTNIKNLRQGIYKIEFSVKDNAGAVGYDTIIVNVLNKKNNASFKLNVYPNPVTTLLNVEVVNAETDMQSSIILYDSKGSVLYKKIVPVYESKRIQQVDMSRLVKGNYFLHVKYGTEPPIVKPIIKI